MTSSARVARRAARLSRRSGKPRSAPRATLSRTPTSKQLLAAAAAHAADSSNAAGAPPASRKQRDKLPRHKELERTASSVGRFGRIFRPDATEEPEFSAWDDHVKARARELYEAAGATQQPSLPKLLFLKGKAGWKEFDDTARIRTKLRKQAIEEVAKTMRVDMWTPQQVSEWLRKTTRLAEYADKFESLHIGGEEILVFGKNPAFVLEPLDATGSQSPPSSSSPETSSSAPAENLDPSTSSAPSPSSRPSEPSIAKAEQSSESSQSSTSPSKLEAVSLSTLIPNQRHRKLFLKKVALLQKEVDTLPVLPSNTLEQTEDTARVWFISPVVSISYVALGVGAHFYFGAWPIAHTRAYLLPINFGLAYCSLRLLMLGREEMNKARTPISPKRPTTALVRTGPFSVTRNPVYVSLMMLLGSLTGSLNNTYLLLMMPAVMGVFHVGLIKPEERYLVKKFGQSFVDYQAKVPRWMEVESWKKLAMLFQKKKLVYTGFNRSNLPS